VLKDLRLGKQFGCNQRRCIRSAFPIAYAGFDISSAVSGKRPFDAGQQPDAKAAIYINRRLRVALSLKRRLAMEQRRRLGNRPYQDATRSFSDIGSNQKNHPVLLRGSIFRGYMLLGVRVFPNNVFRIYVFTIYRCSAFLNFRTHSRAT
jgi:hypothetical protein